MHSSQKERERGGGGQIWRDGVCCGGGGVAAVASLTTARWSVPFLCRCPGLLTANPPFSHCARCVFGICTSALVSEALLSRLCSVRLALERAIVADSFETRAQPGAIQEYTREGTLAHAFFVCYALWTASQASSTLMVDQDGPAATTSYA